jgi:hypothetical protein
MSTPVVESTRPRQRTPIFYTETNTKGWLQKREKSGFGVGCGLLIVYLFLRGGTVRSVGVWRGIKNA